MTANHNGHNVIKKGKTSAGVQRFYCKDCGVYLPTGTQHGGDRKSEQVSGKTPKTPAERWRKWNEKRKRQQQERNDNE